MSTQTKVISTSYDGKRAQIVVHTTDSTDATKKTSTTHHVSVVKRGDVIQFHKVKKVMINAGTLTERMTENVQVFE